jgi:hypothetical protein
MDAVSAEQFLLDQMPTRYRALIPTTLKTAYGAVNLLIAQEPILQVVSAGQNKGRLVSFATDLGFERLIKTGQWPFEFRWRNFAKPTGRYLEVRLSHSVLSISQVNNPKKQPRSVVFRENARLNNEPFFDLEEFRDEREIRGLPHFLLVHGHQELTFAHLGVPHAQHDRNWIFRSGNLMLLPHVVTSEAPVVEDTEFNAAITLKEEIEKWRKDHGEE